MLYLPSTMSAATSLQTKTYQLKHWKSVNQVMRVLFLNLMPLKPQTEADIARTLQQTEVDVQLIPIKIKGQTYKTTSAEHMEACYLDFDEVENDLADALIITGAPVEQIAFEEVRYWPALCHIMDWAQQNVKHTLYICWGAQAGLYHHYGIPKYQLPEKCFGIFQEEVAVPNHPLTNNLEPRFPMPNSRHTEVRKSDILQAASECLTILAESKECGIGIVISNDCKQTFIVGHLEYEAETLHREYHRDLNKNLPIHAPEHYYDANGDILYSWKDAATCFYRNWLLLNQQ